MESEAPSHIASLQGLYERSTNLVLSLYTRSLTASTARNEIVQLTHQIESFPHSTRQIISWLEQAPQLPSQQALKDVEEISTECHRAFDRIDELTSSAQNNSGRGEDDELGGDSSSDTMMRKELNYLAIFLQAMLLTMNVMMHAFQSAKIVMDHR